MTEAPYNNNKLGIVVVLVSMVSVLAIFNSFSYNATAVTTTPSVGVQVGGGTLENPLLRFIHAHDYSVTSSLIILKQGILVFSLP